MAVRYEIHAALHKVKSFVPIARNYWLLVRRFSQPGKVDQVDILEAIHGLAAEFKFTDQNNDYTYYTSRPGEKKVVIQACCIPLDDPKKGGMMTTHGNMWNKPFEKHIVYGKALWETDAQIRWQHAKEALKLLNQKRIVYSDREVGFFDFINENAVYYIAALLMDIQPYTFPGYLQSTLSITRLESLLPPSLLNRFDIPKYTIQPSKAQSPVKVSYKIKAAVINIASALGKSTSFNFSFDHHFWLLVKVINNEEKIEGAIHGLPTQLTLDKKHNIQKRILHYSLFGEESILQAYYLPNPKSNPSQNKRSVLTQDKSIHFVTLYNKNFWIAPSQVKTIYGNEPRQTDALVRWQRAKDYITLFNTRRLPYSSWISHQGIKIVEATNGNSVYCVMSQIMSLKAYRFSGYKSPGFNSIDYSFEEEKILIKRQQNSERKQKGDGAFIEENSSPNLFNRKKI